MISELVGAGHASLQADRAHNAHGEMYNCTYMRENGDFKSAASTSTWAKKSQLPTEAEGRKKQCLEQFNNAE